MCLFSSSKMLGRDFVADTESSASDSLEYYMLGADTVKSVLLQFPQLVDALEVVSHRTYLDHYLAIFVSN